MATFGENLRRVREERGLSQKELAEKMGVGQGQLSNWESDRFGLPETGTVLRAAKALVCSVEDLLSGIDPEYAGHGTHTAGVIGRGEAEPDFTDVSTGYKRDDIPMIAEGDASPQPGLFWEEDGTLKSDIEDRISRPHDVTDPRAYGVKVRGDSMAPIYRPGMKLIVSPNTPARDGDEVYVMLLNGERLLKIARKVPGGWMLESANPAYESRFVKKSEIGAMHPIIWSRRQR